MTIEELFRRLAVESGSRLLAIRYGDPEADRGALSQIRRAAGQYRRRLRLPADLAGDGDPGRLRAAAFPDRIGQIQQLMNGGTAAVAGTAALHAP